MLGLCLFCGRTKMPEYKLLRNKSENSRECPIVSHYERNVCHYIALTDG